VLHLLDPEGCGGGPCTLRLAAAFIRATADLRHQVVILGGNSSSRLAERCGVPRGVELPIPAGVTIFAGRRLARALEDGAAASAPSIARDAVSQRSDASGVRQESASRSSSSLGKERCAALAWSWRAFQIAGSLGARCDLIAAWLALTPSGQGRVRLPWTPNSPVPRCVAGMESVIEPLRHTALGEGRGGWQLLTIPPGVSAPSGPPPEHANPAARALMRARWGAAPEEFVLALAADPVQRGDARLASYGAAIACVTGRRFRLLLHPAAHAAGRWGRWARSTGLMGAVSFDPLVAEPWRIAIGVDAVLGAGEAREAHGSLDLPRRRAGSGVLPLLEYMACGVPVIAERSPAAMELIEDGRNGVLLPFNDRVAAARALLAMRDDQDFRRRLIEEGRRLAARRFSTDAFVAALRQVVEQDRAPGGSRSSGASTRVHSEMKAVAASQ